MDKATATSFVERIEAHREEEDAIWQEMRNLPNYEMHEDKVIKGILDARKTARRLLEEADADLHSFNWIEDEDGDLIPTNPDDDAWPTISIKLRRIAGDDARMRPLVDQIDKLHAAAVSNGLPQVTIRDLEAGFAAFAAEQIDADGPHAS